MSRGNRRLLLATIACGTLLNPLNSSMIAVALVRLHDAFAVEFRDATWLISAYYLASAVGQTVMGKLADRYGFKRLFVIGLAVLGLASAAAPLAPAYGVLLALRALQGVGSSALFPAGVAIVRHAIVDRQARALGVLAVFSATSAAAGPTIGGALIGAFDWQAIFLINVPLCAVGIVLAVRLLPPDPPRPARAAQGVGRILLDGIDLPGVVVFVATLASLLGFLVTLTGDVAWWTLAVAPVAGVLFVLRELRAPAPIVDLRTLAANRALLRVYAQFVLVNVTYYSVLFGLPPFLEEVRGFDVQTVGVIMLPTAGVALLFAPLCARLVERGRLRAALVGGGTAVLIGSILLVTVGESASAAWVMLLLCFYGISTGLNNLGLQSAMYEVTPVQDTGAASGMFQTSRYLGTILSTGLLDLTFGHAIDTGALHVTAIVLVALSACILALALRHAADG